MSVLLVTVAVAVYGLARLGGNIRSVPLFAGLQGNAGTEKADPFGNTPINLLLIGSDSRQDPADCRIGHDCGPGANADVELLVHIAADRTNASVMSIPRDTVTELPACRDPHTGKETPAHLGQINSTLNAGPGCTVAAVHQLTGIPIDHFAMVDFVGVVSMSDAVGGVPVCVSDDVYDPDAHLKLSRGTHTLQGLAALAFVRSRHAFGDGSDLGRTYGQHLFLASLIRTLRGTGVITDPAGVYRLADAASKAVTVDTGLAGIPQLLGLAADIERVPTDRITFTTMPNRPDPADHNRIVPALGADTLFAAIGQDQPLSPSAVRPPTGIPSAEPSNQSSATPPRSTVAVRVENGSGVPGRAAETVHQLIDLGFSPRTNSATTSITDHTVLRYGSGDLAAAAAVARALRLPTDALQAAQVRELTLVIGSDWTAGTSFGPAAGAGDAAGTRTALADAHPLNAGEHSTCASVSRFPSVRVDGVLMTPQQAYVRSSRIPDSAP